MKIFQIKATSPVIYVVIFLSIIAIGGALSNVFLSPKSSSPAVAIFMLVIVVSAFIVPRFPAQARAEWSISESGLMVKWLSQFIFHNRSDLTIRWDEIREYKYRPDRNFYLMKLKLSDGRVIRLWHDTFSLKDDFDPFINALEEQIKDYNQHNEGSSNQIRRARTFYETNFGLALAIITGLCFIVIPILISTSEYRAKINWMSLAIFYRGGLFFYFPGNCLSKKKAATEYQRHQVQENCLKPLLAAYH